MAADGRERSRLEALSRELGLRSIEFTGWVDTDETAELYSTADIYLNASSRDNMPNSILEAFAAGLPVVSTEAGGIPELVRNGETGILVACDDHAELAAGAIDLLTDSEFATRVVDNARAECWRFTWSAVRSEWLALYTTLATTSEAHRSNGTAKRPDLLHAFGGSVADPRAALAGRGRRAPDVDARPRDGSPRSLGGNRRIRQRGELRSTVDGVDVIELPLPRPGFRCCARLPSMQGLPDTARESSGGDRTDVGQHPHGASASMAWLLRCRFVYASAGVHDFNLRSWEHRRWIVWAFGVAFRRADTVIVQTAEQVHLCLERFGREPRMIKSIAPPPQAQSSPPEAFIWIGSLVEHKQPLAFVALARAVPEAQFWMVPVPRESSGSSELAAALDRAAAGVGNLRPLPPRHHAELAPLYERAVAVVSTSRSEGMPNVFMEGWSRGVPALSLTHDPDGVITREAVGAFADGSPIRMATLARSMWQRRDDRDALAQRCRAYVAGEHALQDVADAWEEALF